MKYRVVWSLTVSGIREIAPALMTPGIARICSNSALTKATRLSNSRIAEQRSHEGQDVVAADAEIELPQMLKGLEQQAAARQQHDGESRLDDDQRMLESM